MKKFGCIVILFLSNLVYGQIRVAEPVQNLGDIFESSGRVVTKFKLENPYRNDTIRIVNITTSCGCTAVLTKDTLILPQSAIMVDISYDPKGRLGLFVKSIEISTKTGHEINKFYLKITGNVVAENYTVRNVNTELIEYIVAPIYFYPITAYDTSYLDFNYIGDFINDLTFEIDFYQFTTLGIEVEVKNIEQIEKIENLLRFTKKKIIRSFQQRGFLKETIFFDEPIFKIADSLPAWSTASIRIFSVNFDAELQEESAIKVTSQSLVNETKLLLNYQRFAMPEINEIVHEINFESIEGKLFLNGNLDLRGRILVPEKKSEKFKQKIVKKIIKSIQKRIKKTTGAGKKEVLISIDTIGIHPDNKYQFILWDEADQEQEEAYKYQIKPDNITPPLLPTYQQSYANGLIIDTNSIEFIHFWENLIRNYRQGEPLNLLLISSLSSQKKDNSSSAFGGNKSNLELAIQWGEILKVKLNEKFCNETGGELIITMKNIIQGPKFETIEQIKYSQFEYFAFIPLVHQNPEMKVENAKPYMVNFDYFFNGINTNALGFRQFADYIAATVEKDGFIELRIESSISKIPIAYTSSNLFLAYQRLKESQKRLKLALEKKLIDPNRIVFIDELVVKQGPEYDGTIPILKFRKFHYIRVIPEKTLKSK